MSDKIYDHIVFGASLSGIITSIIKNQQGKSVLLLNFYGFTGGSISESLNCLQKKLLAEEQSVFIVDRILKRIINEKQGLLWEDEENLFLNPEVVKYILQKELEENNIEILFHVTPSRLKIEENRIQGIEFMAKEGLVTFYADNFFDASDNLQLVTIADPDARKIKRSLVNIFISGLKQPTYPILEEAKKTLILNDGRIWASFEIIKDDDLSIEHSVQRKLDEISRALLPENARVQLIPAQSLPEINKSVISFSLKNLSSTENYLHQSFSPEKELIKAKEFEIKLLQN
ncbi:MAG: FAD-dependent oxidoreductase [Ignavibacteriales bacterium]|nr:FAD-dependent oxidoreductase [Ignavibacteriales bacterium]